MGNYEPTLEELCEIDNAGEAELKQYYRENGYKVKDVSLDRYYQVRDTDILLYKDNKEIGIEIKWDSRISETNNMYIEYYNEEKYNNSGWVDFCKATYLAYGDSHNQLYYMILMDDLKTFIKNNKNELPQGIYSRKGNISKGYLLSVESAQANNLIKGIIYLS